MPLIVPGFCDRDESVAAYGAGDRVWELTEIDQNRFPASAMLAFPKPGEIAGQAPCNSYTASLDAPYPWFEMKNFASSQSACDALLEEGTYFAALMAMTEVEVSGDVLILRNDSGHEMVFTAVD
ncbi:MAG: META domain-containing protein [Pseudomonadota bacterium]